MDSNRSSRRRFLKQAAALAGVATGGGDRKSTRLNSSHTVISYAVFCLILPQPRSTLFPYTTLFRSDENDGSDSARRPGGDGALPIRPLSGSSVMVQMFRRNHGFQSI